MQNKISTACPKCESSDTQSFQMAYQAGTSSGNLRFATHSADAGFGIGGGRTSSQTLLAENVQPPIAQNVFIEIFALFAFITIIFFFVVFIVASIYSFLSGLICGTVAAGIAYYILNRHFTETSKRREKEYKYAFSKWSRSWICLRCGESWMLRKQ